MHWAIHYLDNHLFIKMINQSMYIQQGGPEKKYEFLSMMMNADTFGQKTEQTCSNWL